MLVERLKARGKKRLLHFVIGFLLVAAILASLLGRSKGKAEAVNGAAGSGQASLITNRDNFYGVHAGDKGHVWIVGYWGKIIHSPDGGKTWQIQIPLTYLINRKEAR